MNLEEKMKKCEMFFYALAEELNDYEVIGSCNQDLSAYLVPLGTANEITYASKPARSFRISDHWNWYANVKRNPNPMYVQCLSVDVPCPKRRKGKGKASEPRIANQVAMIGDDGKYHVIFGEKWDKKLQQWSWIENDPLQIAAAI